VVEDDVRWLVAPYGEVGWVRNARAAGEVQLTRPVAASDWRLRMSALTRPPRSCSDTSSECRVVRPFIDVSPDSPLAEFETEAPHHPVFRLTDTSDALSR